MASVIDDLNKKFSHTLTQRSYTRAHDLMCVILSHVKTGLSDGIHDI